MLKARVMSGKVLDDVDAESQVDGTHRQVYVLQLHSMSTLLNTDYTGGNRSGCAPVYEFYGFLVVDNLQLHCFGQE